MKGIKMKTQATLTKVKWNKGVLENGTSYDYTRVTIQMPIYENSFNEFGVDSLDCEYGTEAQHVDLLHLKGKLPCEIECDMQQIMRRGKPVTMIANIKSISKDEKKSEKTF